MRKFLLAMITLVLHVALESFGTSIQSGLDSNQTSPTKAKPKFVVDEWKPLFNRAFGSILGSVGPNNDIGNYASFDPAEGSFKFKGVAPLGKEKKSISYLSLSVQGGISSSDFNKIFDGFKIGTNSTVQGEYHFKRRVKSKSITRESEVEAIYNRQKSLTENQADLEINYLKLEQQKSKARLIIIENTIVSVVVDTPQVRKKLETSLSDVGEFKKAIENASLQPTDSLLEAYKSAIKKASGYASQQDSLKDLLIKLNRASDSLKVNLKDSLEIRLYMKNSINAKRDARLDTLQNNYKFSKFKINWITLIGSLGKKSYYTFDSALAFDEQIKDGTLYTNSFGLAWSLYIRNDTEKRSSLLNVGILRKKDNNTDTLTTMDVNQEKIIKNEKEDIVKKISKKYSSYTDPIETNQLIHLYLNYFYVFGKRQSALHLFPSYSKPDKKTGSLNFGIGYIVSFKNQKKDNPLINAELYALNSDFFNSRNGSRNFRERCEIGLKFSLPFNLF